ncbi:hypothetical protein [Jeotgalibacillus sp. R-1-5s-1]|uniref:hypothetical protein n=1 Tax=Jeotgalibacillus sp. R-1-5s-1 TaxID=2555897 RepID=UPI0010698B97|nr:hypothetical protein [Jeotgalibacillus sp. R-1-5s-1]TFD99980.1 hypothetical protein E2491_05920 [Jeotgalibacillus sp. R-1-5s-1]
MNDFATLRLLDRFAPLFRRAGIDYPMLRLILGIKLTMDTRRVPTVFAQSKVKDGKNYFIRSLWVYALYGLTIIPFLFFDDYFFQMSVIFGILMFILMTSMVSDFSSVLLDVRDRNMMVPKPVDQRTISTAKMLHITLYMSLLTIATAGIPLFVSLYVNGFGFFLLFLAELILLNFLILMMTALVYFAILQFFDGEKLKNVINFMQIALTLGIIIGYQLVARSFQLTELDWTFQPAWWQLFTPPVWFGALHEALLSGERSLFVIVLAALAVTTPVISMILYIKLIPSFESSLHKLSTVEQGKEKRVNRLKQAFLRFIAPDQEERNFMNFSFAMMKNEREFKLKVYPQVGFTFVIPFLFMFTTTEDGAFEALREGSSYYLFYFTLLVIPTVISMVKYSGTYKGSWIYAAMPLRDRVLIDRGLTKSVLVMFYLPIMLILAPVFIWIFSGRIWLDLIVIMATAILYAAICTFALNGKSLPFSQPFSVAQHQEGIKAFIMMLVIGGFCLIHVLFKNWAYGLEIYAVILLIAIIIVWTLGFRRIRFET